MMKELQSASNLHVSSFVIQRSRLMAGRAERPNVLLTDPVPRADFPADVSLAG